jgi:hypothetical protein
VPVDRSRSDGLAREDISVAAPREAKVPAVPRSTDSRRGSGPAKGSTADSTELPSARSASTGRRPEWDGNLLTTG